MFAYCVSAAYQEAASVARHGGPRCASRRAPKGAVKERIHRGAGSGASTDVLREIGAPGRKIGVELDVYPREVVARASAKDRSPPDRAIYGCDDERRVLSAVTAVVEAPRSHHFRSVAAPLP